MSSQSRKKILISAYACSPYKGSEPGVGWGFVAELSKHHDLWVIVEEVFFREHIERFINENPGSMKSVNFYFIPAIRKPLLRKLWPPSFYYFYRQWHRDAFDLAVRLSMEVKFDVVHQLTMVGFREPGYLWRLGIPFVWGPVGGIGLFPWRFLPTLGLKGAIYYLAYNLLNWLQVRFYSRPKKAACIADIGLIAATPENQMGAAQYWGNKKASLISEVGLPSMYASKPCLREPNQHLHIIWAGQHTPGKALNLGLEALAGLSKTQKWHLHVLGEGESSHKWKNLAADLGIEERITFYGWLPRDEALRMMQKGHLMLISSLRDLTSTVTIEALAQGLPIVCLDHCGFSDVVNERCGIKVAVTSPTAAIKDLRDAISRLEADESFRRELALGALERARNFSWETKVTALNRIYSEVIAAHDGNA